MLRAAIYYIMSQELYLNILDPQYARYIDLRHDLQEYLEEMYGNDIDFGISVSEPRGRRFAMMCQRPECRVDLTC
jgi:hypothetical protein